MTSRPVPWRSRTIRGWSFACASSEAFRRRLFFRGRELRPSAPLVGLLARTSSPRQAVADELARIINGSSDYPASRLRELEATLDAGLAAKPEMVVWPYPSMSVREFRDLAYSLPWEHKWRQWAESERIYWETDYRRAVVVPVTAAWRRALRRAIRRLDEEGEIPW